MLNKDILGIIRGDIKRTRKPKKQMEDYLIGEDEIIEENIRDKRKKESRDDQIIDELDVAIGGDYGEEKKSKPQMKMMDFGVLNKLMAKDQIRELKKEYIVLFETLEDVTDELAKERSEKYDIEVKLNYLKKEMKELKRVFREILNYFPDAYELKVEVDSSDWKIQKLESRFFEKLENLKSNVKVSGEKIEEEQLKAEEQKKLMISEIESTRELVVKAEKEKFNLRSEITLLKKQVEGLTGKLEQGAIAKNEDGREKHPLEMKSVVSVASPTAKKEKEEKVELNKGDAFSKSLIEEYDFDGEIDEIEVPEVPEIEEFEEFKEVEKIKEAPEKKDVSELEKPTVIEEKERYVQPEKVVKEEDDEASTFVMPKFKDLSEFDKVEVKKEDAPNYLFISVDKYLEGMSERGKAVIKIIGDTGVEKNVDLMKLLEDDAEGNELFYQGGKLLKNEFNNTIKNLRDRQFLESHYLKLGSKGGYDYLVFKLSDIGQAIYYKLFDKSPVESEMDKVLGPHASLEHGYLIKEIAVEFKEMGYKVYEKREDCTYDVGDGKRKVFDMIIEDSEGYKMHIEVERGTHNNQDFSNMLDKIYAVTQDIYIIAPSEKILLKEVKGKVFSWITNKMGGFESARGKVKFNFTTFEKLKQRKTKIWERFEP